MTEQDECECTYEIEYYLLDDDSVGRVWFDPATEEYVDGEALTEEGSWEDCPPLDILERGVCLTEAEAREHIRALGGAM